jgi:heme/copper-type cytochrome/quinol oxidase subunit 3
MVEHLLYRLNYFVGALVRHRNRERDKRKNLGLLIYLWSKLILFTPCLGIFVGVFPFCSPQALCKM